jgi:catechol 2,3-dioxygenase-like lactoylglutathione lyase family enzyme
MLLLPEDLYHTGIVVANLEAAARRLSGVAGYTWTDVVEYEIEIVTQQGRQTVDLRFVYSVEAPHLELIQEMPGTPWTASRDNAVHHLGYFTDDIQSAMAALEAHGFTMEMGNSTDGGRPNMFAYFVDTDGTRIELVDRTVMGDWHAFLDSLCHGARQQ